ncbi:MAG: hypothetical protein LUE87_08350 [Lachnospiraceae bacterium]|nr:hypothetical protein [Lachnospiraceae bacterium]
MSNRQYLEKQEQILLCIKNSHGTLKRTFKIGDMINDKGAFWKQEEISDIGHTLKRIINGTYASEN